MSNEKRVSIPANLLFAVLYEHKDADKFERARVILDQELKRMESESDAIPMRLICPSCATLHIDEGEFATKPHHTHACQGCGMVWRPALVHTVGVQFLPGFKNEG